MSANYGAMSTADDILSGIDLRGRRILVTGVSSGIGVETARVLVTHGASVLGTARNLSKARGATEQIHSQAAMRGNLDLIELDLAALASVRRCADTLLNEGKLFDIIIANAGVMASPQGKTADGFETQFGTNHLGHFVLINRIAGLIKSGGRLVVVASAGHRGADVDLDDPNFEHTAYDPLTAYRRSKTANILFAVEFNQRHKAEGIRAMAVHPGAVLTETTLKMIERQPSAASTFAWKTVAQGAATSIWAAFMAAPDDIGGSYCEDCHIADVIDDPSIALGVRSYALDRTRAKALWAKSEQMTGETF